MKKSDANPEVPAVAAADIQANLRTLDKIAADVLVHTRNIEASFLEIGKCLIEAKAQCKHGEWLKWLEDVSISEVTAQRLMRVAREFPNPTALTDLGFTKALEIIALPPAKRDEVVSKPHDVGGEMKTVDEMTSREFKAVVDKHKEPKNSNSNKLTKTKKTPSMTKTDFHDKCKTVRLGLDCLLEYLDAMKGDSEQYSDISSAIRSMCESTLNKLPKLETS